MDSTRVNSGSPHTRVFDFSHNGGAEKVTLVLVVFFVWCSNPRTRPWVYGQFVSRPGFRLIWWGATNECFLYYFSTVSFVIGRLLNDQR